MKIVKGCLIVLAVLFLLLAAGATYVYVNRDKILNSVTDAISETALADNAVVINQLDKAANLATTFPEFAAAVEALDLPPNIIYVAATDNATTLAPDDLDDGRTPIIKRVDWTGRTYKVFNGIGAASLETERGPIPAIIIERTGDWNYMVDYVVYLEQSTTDSATPVATPGEEPAE